MGESYQAGVERALRTVEDGAPDGALLSCSWCAGPLARVSPLRAGLDVHGILRAQHGAWYPVGTSRWDKI